MCDEWRKSNTKMSMYVLLSKRLNGVCVCVCTICRSKSVRRQTFTQVGNNSWHTKSHSLPSLFDVIPYRLPFIHNKHETKLICQLQSGSRIPPLSICACAPRTTHNHHQMVPDGQSWLSVWATHTHNRWGHHIHSAVISYIHTRMWTR
jgi:hypothetical protein